MPASFETFENDFDKNLFLNRKFECIGFSTSLQHANDAGN